MSFLTFSLLALDCGMAPQLPESLITASHLDEGVVKSPVIAVALGFPWVLGICTQVLTLT